MNYRVLFINTFLICSIILPRDKKPVAVAILAKDKAHTLSLYLSCLEKQTWPKNKTLIYIRTNNNNDETATILRNWVETVKDQYLGIHFDDSDVAEQVQQYGQHEWNSQRFKVLGKIRQDSIDWALQKGAHYFVADCDNFIVPETIEALEKAHVPIVAPLLHSNNAYSNFHADIDQNGYLLDHHLYFPLLNLEIKGLVQLPVVHCTYFIRHNYLADMSYDDESYRYEYVIFSDTARKKNIPQYLDTRRVYGFLTFAETVEQLESEPWIDYFSRQG